MLCQLQRCKYFKSEIFIANNMNNNISNVILFRNFIIACFILLLIAGYLFDKIDFDICK